MASEKNKIIVDGYAFNNANDAALAEEERKKVEYLRAHLDTGNPDKVLNVLSKAIEENIFKTPIGMDFLRETQMFLLNQCDYTEAEVPTIPVSVQYNRSLRSEVTETKAKIAPEPKKKEKIQPLFISVLLNILLIAAVVAMFVITLRSDNPNILNYETAINNKYSYWAEQLNEQESELREKEKELKIREQELEEREAELSTEN